MCLESLKSTGKHRSVSLKCGHVFGKKCIADWIKAKKGAAECPNCKARCRKTDLRDVFLPSGSVVDAGETERLKEELAASNRLLAETRMTCELLEAKAARWEAMNKSNQPQKTKKERVEGAQIVARVALESGRLLSFHRHDGSVLLSQGHRVGRVSLASPEGVTWYASCHAAGCTLRSLDSAPGKSPLVLSASSDRSVCVWSAESGNLVHSINGLLAVPMACAWSDANSHLQFAVAQKNSVLLYDLRNMGNGPAETVAMPWEQPVHSFCRLNGRLVAASLGGAAVLEGEKTAKPLVEGPAYSVAAEGGRMLCSLRQVEGARHKLYDASGRLLSVQGPFAANTLLSRSALHGNLAAFGDEAGNLCRIVNLEKQVQFDALALAAPCLDVALFEYGGKSFVATACAKEAQLCHLST